MIISQNITSIYCTIRKILLICYTVLFWDIRYLKSILCKLSNAKKSFQYNTYLCSYGQNDISTGFPFWPRKYMFSIVLVWSPFWMYVRALVIIAGTAFWTIRTVFFIMLTNKEISNPVLKIMKWKLVGPYHTRHSLLFTLPQRKIIQRYKVVQVTQCCAPVRHLFSETILAVNCELPESLWQVAPSWKKYTLRMAPLHWSPISHVL